MKSVYKHFKFRNFDFYVECIPIYFLTFLVLTVKIVYFIVKSVYFTADFLSS